MSEEFRKIEQAALQMEGRLEEAELKYEHLSKRIEWHASKLGLDCEGKEPVTLLDEIAHEAEVARVGITVL